MYIYVKLRNPIIVKSVHEMTIDLKTMLAFSCYWCPLQHNDIIKAISVTCDCFYHPIISDETAGTLCVLVCKYKFRLIDMHEIVAVQCLSICILPELFVFFCIVSVLLLLQFCCLDFFYSHLFRPFVFKCNESPYLVHFRTYKLITETQIFRK